MLTKWKKREKSSNIIKNIAYSLLIGLLQANRFYFQFRIRLKPSFDLRKTIKNECFLITKLNFTSVIS